MAPLKSPRTITRPTKKRCARRCGDAADRTDCIERIRSGGTVVGVMVDGEAKVGFGTPSRKLEFFSPTLREWGWPEKEYTIPWPLKSHVHPDNIDRDKGEMLLLPNFRLPTLIHTRSANAKWLYEISHKNPVWMHPQRCRAAGRRHRRPDPGRDRDRLLRRQGLGHRGDQAGRHRHEPSPGPLAACKKTRASTRACPTWPRWRRTATASTS